MPPTDSIFIFYRNCGLSSTSAALGYSGTRIGKHRLPNPYLSGYIYQLCIIKPLSIIRFKQNYEHYILRGTDKNASDREQRIGSTVAKVRIQFEYA